MSRTERTLHAPADQVWSVLSDGWLYPMWVVGASRMREVEDRWPERGSRLHHSVGTWPVVVDDTTEVVDVDPGTLLVLRARAWPTGSAEVRITLVPVPGEVEATAVVLEEDVVRGPARLVPAAVRAPALGWRNRETLLRLAYLAERRR